MQNSTLSNSLTTFLVARSIGENRWKKVGECRFKNNRFADCDYNLPIEVCQAIGKTAKWMLNESITPQSVDFEVGSEKFRLHII